MEMASDWKPIATAPADADVELSVFDQGEYHALVYFVAAGTVMSGAT